MFSISRLAALCMLTGVLAVMAVPVIDDLVTKLEQDVSQLAPSLEEDEEMWNIFRGKKKRTPARQIPVSSTTTCCFLNGPGREWEKDWFGTVDDPLPNVAKFPLRMLTEGDGPHGSHINGDAVTRWFDITCPFGQNDWKVLFKFHTMYQQLQGFPKGSSAAQAHIRNFCRNSLSVKKTERSLDEGSDINYDKADPELLAAVKALCGAAQTNPDRMVISKKMTENDHVAKYLSALAKNQLRQMTLSLIDKGVSSRSGWAGIFTQFAKSSVYRDEICREHDPTC